MGALVAFTNKLSSMEARRQNGLKTSSVCSIVYITNVRKTTIFKQRVKFCSKSE